MNHDETRRPVKTRAGDELHVLRAALGDGTRIPDEVLLAPWGWVESANGSFRVDRDGIESAEQAFERHGTDLPIDYEHQTLGGPYAAPDGRAPAAGWIKALIARPGKGLFARIEWTAPGRRHLETKAYRYLSPVVIVRKSDRRLTAVHSAALTNKPAIVKMTPIVNADPTTVEDQADLPVGANGAGDVNACHDGATPTDQATPPCVAALPDVEGESSDRRIVPAADPMARLRETLELDEHADLREVLLVAGQRLAALTRKERDRRAERRVAEALATGRLVEAQRDWALTLALKDEALFDRWLRTAPCVVSTGCTAPPARSNVASVARACAEHARAEYRAEPLLQQLTTEDAYVESTVGVHGQAVRDA